MRSGASGDTDYVESNGLMEEYAFSFTTGTETLPRLVLDHELTVDFEVVEKDYFPAARTHPCGGGLMGACEPDGKYAAVNAIVHVPPVSGGHAAGGYRGVVDYTTDVPSGLDAQASRPPSEALLATQYFEMEANQALDLALSVNAGTPCFQVVVSDSAGQSITSILRVSRRSEARDGAWTLVARHRGCGAGGVSSSGVKYARTNRALSDKRRGPTPDRNAAPRRVGMRGPR